jgi:hypothetical protein
MGFYAVSMESNCVREEDMRKLRREKTIVPHVVSMFDGSSVKRDMVLIHAGPKREVMLACPVTGTLFQPDTGICSTWQVRAKRVAPPPAEAESLK